MADHFESWGALPNGNEPSGRFREASLKDLAGRPNNLRRWSLTVTLGVALWSAALAASSRAAPIDQVWVGVFGHSITHTGRLEAGTQDYVLEIDTARPRILRPLGAPRVSIAISVNSARHSDLASLGLVWDHRLAGPVYGSVDLGLGVTDGLIEPRPDSEDAINRKRLLLGSRVLFRAGVGLDWRISRRWSVGVEFIHASNGNILGPHPFNEGINDAGLRVGYRFN